MRHLQLPNKSIFSKLGILILVAGLTFAGCDTVSDDGGNSARVTVQFQTVSPTNNISSTLFAQVGDTLRVEGYNGTLLINDIRFIVDDFELEAAEGECEGLEGEQEDDCAEFEAELFYVDLPLKGDSLELTTSPIKEGMYDELEFEIDDFDVDQEEDEAEQQQKEAFLAEIRQEFAEWPESASMVIGGKFLNNRGERIEFYTFAEGEIEVEKELNPPLEVTNGVTKSISVKINPAAWFKRADGSVINLSNYDYFQTEGKILDLEAAMQEGFESSEVGED